MFDSNYETSDKLFFHDKLMRATVLKLIPQGILPNHFTFLRMLATPVVAILMFYHHYTVALVAFLLVAFTDTIDGSLARTRNQITNWGRIYDPLADKILVGCAVFIIVLRYIDIWTAFLIVGIEVVIVAVAWWRKKEGARIQSNIWGKIKMILQVAGVAILLLSVVFGWAEILPLASGTLYLAIAFAVVSLLSYGI